MGNSVKLGENSCLYYDGLYNVGFNLVEGYWLVMWMRYIVWGEKNNFELGVILCYGFFWDCVVWCSDVSYKFGVDYSCNQFGLYGGCYVLQYNESWFVSEFFNMFYVFLGECNFVNIYEKCFLGVSWCKVWCLMVSFCMNVEWVDWSIL